MADFTLQNSFQEVFVRALYQYGKVSIISGSCKLLVSMDVIRLYGVCIVYAHFLVFSCRNVFLYLHVLHFILLGGSIRTVLSVGSGCV